MDNKAEIISDAPMPKVMRSPRSIDLELTSRCNLRCGYCYYFENEAVSYQDLPTGEWLKFLAELGANAVMSVTLQGGEPLMRKDLPELIDGVVANRMRFSILTNGTLVDRKLARHIADTGRCNNVQFSIDGSCAAVHDAVRGEGSFEKAIAGLRLMQEAGVPVWSRVTINRKNVADLENIAEFLLDELGLPGFGTNSACFFGACRHHTEELMLTVEDRMEAMRSLTRLAERYGSRIVATAGPLSEARRWSLMDQARKKNAEAFPDAGRLTGCGCHFSSMAVRSDGTMIPCVMLAHMEMGRINHEDLGEVWRNSPLLRMLRTRQHIPLSEFEHCEGCTYKPYCTGNCPGLSYTITGRVNHPAPDACLRDFLRSGGRLEQKKDQATDD